MAYLTFATFNADPANAGITEAFFNQWIVEASALIDRIAGWPDGVFELQTALTQYVIAGERKWLRFPFPPVTITSLEVVSQRTTTTQTEIVAAVDEQAYWINGTYPRLRIQSAIQHLGRGWQHGTIYKLVGNAGFVTAAGATPPPIAGVLSRLLRFLYQVETSGDDEWARGFVRQFATDNFSYELGAGAAGAIAGMLEGSFTGRPDIDGVLHMFRPAVKTASTLREAPIVTESGYPSGTFFYEDGWV